jgi:hypothetical protein
MDLLDYNPGNKKKRVVDLSTENTQDNNVKHVKVSIYEHIPKFALVLILIIKMSNYQLYQQTIISCYIYFTTIILS